MDRRWWRVQATADLDPSRRLSTFMLASVESSYELRIDRRITAGAGAKLTLFRKMPPIAASDRTAERTLPSVANRLDDSLALTAEQNVLPQTGTTPPVTSNLARLSLRLRWTQRVASRWWFDPDDVVQAGAAEPTTQQRRVEQPPPVRADDMHTAFADVATRL